MAKRLKLRFSLLVSMVAALSLVIALACGSSATATPVAQAEATTVPAPTATTEAVAVATATPVPAPTAMSEPEVMEATGDEPYGQLNVGMKALGVYHAHPGLTSYPEYANLGVGAIPR